MIASTVNQSAGASQKRKIIHLVAAARPNFIKIAPLYHALKKESWAEPLIIHTGQHYDPALSAVFFHDLCLPDPHAHLGVGSGSHAEQTARVLVAYEQMLLEHPPDLVVVAGDVNSTPAAALAAVKLGIKVAHLEAGLRSFDRTMPEEINRVVTDSLADFLWTPSEDADQNLRREGIPEEKIARVGNIMIDSLEMCRQMIESESCLPELGLSPKQYGLVTLHRPANVDTQESLEKLCAALLQVAAKIHLVFPVHPRTKKSLVQFRLLAKLSEGGKISVMEPVSYLRFMNLVFHSRLLITDSGGIQEETTYLGIPCLTLRSTTERPVTVKRGTNRLCKVTDLGEQVDLILAGKWRQGEKIELWDGNTAGRIISSLKRFFFDKS